MRKIALSVLLGLAVALALVAAAYAKEYVVDVIVDGKTVTLSIVVDDDALTVDTQAPGVEVVSVTAVEATSTPTTAPTATANRNANLRGGPGTSYPVVGSVRTGQALAIVGRNGAGDWLQLTDGEWIAAFLVNNAPPDIQSVPAQSTDQAPPAATPTPPPPPTATPVPAPTFTPTRNCDPSYPTLCIPLNSPDLNCPDIQIKNFPVLPPDPHGFDRDRDGIGCES